MGEVTHCVSVCVFTLQLIVNIVTIHMKFPDGFVGCSSVTPLTSALV